MLAIQEFAPQRLVMTLSGQIDARDVEALETALHPYLEDEGSVNAVIDVSAAEDASSGTLFKNATFEARTLAQLDKVGRLAVVSGGQGAHAVPSAFEAMMPPGAVGRFAPGRLQEARAFVA